MQQTLPVQGSNTLYFTELLIITTGLQTTCTKISGVTLVELRLLHCTTRVGTLGAVK